jgi:putative endonuclease
VKDAALISLSLRSCHPEHSRRIAAWVEIEAPVNTYYVYMMASHTKVLYIGVTNNIEARVQQHKMAPPTTFTGKYSVSRLVWYEDYPDAQAAIAREKQLKGWRRSKKVALIQAGNPNWMDISYRWFREDKTGG